MNLLKYYIVMLGVVFLCGWTANATPLADPVFDSTPVTSVTYGTAYSYAIAVSDVDGGVLTIASVNTPGWLAFIDNGDGTASLTGNPTAAGDYAIELTVTDPDLNTVSQNFTLTVDKKVLTATVNDVSKEYGAALPTFTISYSGFVGSDTEADLDGIPTASTSATNSSAVGDYSIAASGGTDNNYSYSYIAGTLSITKKVLTATVNDVSKEYGAALPTFTISYSGFAGGDTEADLDGTPTASTSATNTSAVGDYSIAASGGTDNNYSYSYIAGTLSITKKVLTATVNDVSKEYGAALPTFTISYSGFAGIDSEADLNSAPIANTAANANSGVGDYSIVVSGGVDNNYSFNYVAGTLTIDPKTLVATATDATKEYGAINPVFTITYVGFVGTDNAASLGNPPSVITTAGTLSDVGNYSLTFNPGTSNNYAFSYVDGNLEITKKELTVTPKSYSKSYGSANPTFEVDYSGFAGTDNASVIDTAPSTSTSATTASVVGNYAINAASANDNNYSFSYQIGNLEITKKELVVTANDKTRFYGVANPVLDFNYSGFVLGETNAVIALAPTATTVATQSSNVGVYPIALSGANDDNYSFSYVSGNLSIQEQTLTVTALDKSRDYGTLNPVLELSYSGFVLSDSESSLDIVPTASTLATTTSQVGDYAITPSGGTALNYAFNYVPGTLSVLQKELVATAEDQTRIYGENNPVLSVSYTGFVNGEQASDLDVVPQVTTTATEFSDVGFYSLTVSGGSDANYSYSFQPGTLAITKREISVTANNKTRAFGEVNPVLDFTYAGFVFSDNTSSIDLAPQASTSAVPLSNVGNYPITLSGGSDNNYSFAFTNGLLTIEKASASLLIDQNQFTYTASPIPIELSTFPAGLTTEVLYDGSSDVPVNAGVFNVVATINEQNYEGDLNTTQTINKAEAQILITNTNQNYDGNPKPVSVLTNPPSLVHTATYNGSTTVPSNPGEYAVIVEINESNYFGTANASLQINGAPVISDASSVTKNEDAPDFEVVLYDRFEDDYTLDNLLLYSLVSNSNPALFESFLIENGSLKIALAANQFGTSNVAIQATDEGGLQTTLSFSINITSVEDNPSFDSSPITSIDQDTPYNYAITFSDADPGSVLMISALLPDWLSLGAITNNSAVLSGTPGNGEVGIHTVVLEVEDENSNKDIQFFQITVNNVNDIPTFISSPILSIEENALYAYTIITNDIDNDPLVITAVEKPDWLSFVDNGDGTAVLSGTADDADLGDFNIKIRVVDGQGGVTLQEYTLSAINVNDKPVFTSSPLLTATEDVLYQYVVTTSDEDSGEVLTIRILSAPDWLSLEPISNGVMRLVGTPLNDNVGEQIIVLNVEDGNGSNTNQNFTITVANANDTPFFVSAPSLAVTQDDVYTYDILTDDEDKGDSRTITAVNIPGWLSLTDNGNGTAMLTGTPLNSDLGSNFVELKVTDDAGLFSIQSFNIQVINTNDPPTFTSTPVSNATQGINYQYLVETEDLDANDVLTISALSLPNWLEITDNGDGTALVSGLPENEDVGEVGIVLQVADAVGATHTQTYTLTINNVNDAPFFLSNPITVAVQGIEYSYAILIDDIDQGESHVIASVVLPSWLNIQDNGDGSAILSGTPSNANLGANPVKIKVTDASGATTFQEFDINVNNTNDLPYFTTTPALSAIEDVAYSYTVACEDPDIGDVLTLTAGVIPDWLTFTDNGDGTGLLTGTPSNEDVGNNSIVLFAEDNFGAKVFQNFTIEVSNTNDTPVITSNPITGALQDIAYAYTVTGFDQDVNDVIHFELETAPSWLNLEDNNDGTANLTGTPTNANLGTHEITIKVLDLELAFSEQTFTLNVTNTNDAPVFISAPVIAVEEDENYVYNIIGSDPDIDDVLRFEALSIPDWLTLEDFENGQAKLSGLPLNVHVGNNEVILKLSDGLGAFELQTFTIVVQNTNDLPEFISVPISAAFQDVPYEYNIEIEDVDLGDVLAIESVNAISWLSFSDLGGGLAILEGTPSNSDLGNFDIQLKVTDISGIEVFQEFTLVVNNANDPPIFTSTPVTSVEEDSEYNYLLRTEDQDAGDIMSFTALSIPSWLSLTDNGNGTALLSGVPKNEDVGEYDLVIQVSDLALSKVNQSFKITVSNQNDAPYFISDPITNGLQDVEYKYSILATDDDVNDVIAISSSVLPDWLSLTDNGNGNAVLIGTPDNVDFGTHAVVLVVTDLEGAQIEQSFTINIANKNDIPEFVSTPIISAEEDELYEYIVEVSDADAGDEISIFVITKPDWLSFIDIGGGRAILSGAPKNEDVGVHQVVINAQDLAGELIIQDFNITVNNTNDAPQIVSTPILEAKQNQAYVYVIKAEDQDVGDAIQFEAIQIADWMTLTDLGDGNATLTGTPLLEHVGTPVTIKVKVFDALDAIDLQEFEISIEIENFPPTINAIADQNMEEDDDPITIPLTGISDGGDGGQNLFVSVSTPSNTIVQDFDITYAAPDSEGILTISLKENAYGSAEVKVTVQDDGAEDINYFTESFNLTVVPVFDAPVITSTPELRVIRGENYSYAIEFTDPDPEDTHQIIIADKPDWLTLSGSELSGIPPADFSTHQVIVRIEDDKGLSAEQRFDLLANEAPVLSAATVNGLEDVDVLLQSAFFNANYTDLDGDAIAQIRILQLPADGVLSINGTPVNVNEWYDYEASTVFTLQPKANFNGLDDFLWEAFDGYNTSTNQVQVIIEFEPVNDPATIDNLETEPLVFAQGFPETNITLSATITDVDNTNLTGLTVSIEDGYIEGDDLLKVELQSGSLLTVNFNATQGVLEITGEDSKSNYEAVLSNIKYVNTNLKSKDNQTKTLKILPLDGIDIGQGAERLIQIENIFPDLNIVNAFTPNQDGHNDTWNILELEYYENVMVKIYDMDGVLVFTSDGYEEEWDGTKDGNDLKAGPYFYHIDANNGQRTFTGTVNILR